MNAITPFANEDFKLIKWEIALALVSILLVTGIFLGSNYLEAESITELRLARAEYERARSSVELIEDEEATIIEYIDRYQQLSGEGVVEVADRLQFHEMIAEIRADNSLFPISFLIGEQNSLALQYSQAVREPGGPINLDSSSIDLNLPLLHEDDLSRLLNAIADGPGLFQTRECTITLQNTNSTNFFVLAQHQRAECKLFWYTFDLNPPVATTPY